MIRVAGPTTPVDPKVSRFGLFPPRSPLLRESLLISFRRATEMFQFTRGPPPCLCVQQGVSRHHSGWVAPFGYSRLIACLQLPLNVSPVSASFFGFQRPGIHHVLCVACLYFDMCSVLVLCFINCSTAKLKKKVFGFECSRIHFPQEVYQVLLLLEHRVMESYSIEWNSIPGGSPTTGEWKTAGRPGGRPNWKQVCSTWEWMSLKAS